MWLRSSSKLFLKVRLALSKPVETLKKGRNPQMKIFKFYIHDFLLHKFGKDFFVGNISPNSTWLEYSNSVEYSTYVKIHISVFELPIDVSVCEIHKFDSVNNSHKYKVHFSTNKFPILYFQHHQLLHHSQLVFANFAQHSAKNKTCRKHRFLQNSRRVLLRKNGRPDNASVQDSVSWAL